MNIDVRKFSELSRRQWADVKKLRCKPNYESYMETFFEESDKYMIDRYCIICEEEGKVVGAVVFENFAHFIETCPDEVERLHIFVLKKWRNKGIGAKLLDAASDFAKEKRFSLSGFHNKWSEKLYKKFHVKNIF